MPATFAKPPARRRPPAWLGALLLAAALAGAAAGIHAATAGPDRGDAAGSTAAVPCFGAAAWDREHPCHNPALAHVVEPAPVDAERAPNSPCSALQEHGLLRVCSFGVPAPHARGAVALVGDSHASHWRAALEDVASAHGWHGVSLARSSCPLSRATRNIPEPRRSQCSRWNREALGWLRQHPEVGTVFTGQLSGGKGVIAPGRDQFEARVDGYLRAWRALPASVRHIVVIRDTPKARRHGQMAACVSLALAQRRGAGQACSVRRPRALDPDPAVVAAERAGSPRVQVLDMTDFFCRSGRCPPVIGGALVYKDANHLTRVYVATLGPIVRRRVGALMAAWR